MSESQMTERWRDLAQRSVIAAAEAIEVAAHMAELAARDTSATAVIAEAEQVVQHSPSMTIITAALAVADETLRELRAAELTAPVAGRGGRPLPAPPYWVGRLEGALSTLVWAVRDELV